jgi:hypothetical protein
MTPSATPAINQPHRSVGGGMPGSGSGYALMERSDGFIELPSGISIPASALPTATRFQRPGGPSSFDQVLVRPRASDLGLPDLTLNELRELAARIPFEAAYVAASRIAPRLWQVRDDGRAQLEIAREVFGDVPLIDLYRGFLDRYENGAILSEQQLFIVQRLLVEHAQDTRLDAELTEEQIANFGVLLVHGHDIADATHMHIERGEFTEAEILAYLIQAGAYSHRPSLLNSLARSFTLWVEYARRMPDDRLPLDVWFTEDGFDLGVEQQLSVGFGFGASTHVFDEDPSKHAVLLSGPFLRDTGLAACEQQAIALLSAERDWFLDAFEATDDAGSVRNVAWEITPFLQKPFLRLSDGRLCLTSPRSIVSWLGDGFYYRLLSSSKQRSTKKDDRVQLFTSYYGQLIEAYALDLLRAAYENTADTRVFGEMPYGKGAGKMTPDIVVDCQGGIVAFEVRSGFLARRVRVAGEPKELMKDLDRLLFQKVRQLGNRIADLITGVASVSDISFTDAAEIWPIIVTANITLVEHLYNWIERERPESLKHPPVQSVIVLDLEDLEFLAGLIEQQNPILELLRDRDKSDFRKLEFSRYALDQLGADSRTRSKLTEAAWERSGELMKDTLRFAPEG